MEASDANGRPFNNAIKLIGEGLCPGASLLLDGKVVAGGAHAIAGTLARSALGPLGLALVVANSYATSTTGKSLLKQFQKGGSDGAKDGLTETKDGAAETKAEDNP